MPNLPVGEGDDLADPNNEALVKRLKELNELQKQGQPSLLVAAKVDFCNIFLSV